MNHDLDDLLRDTMRRHADDSTGTVDLDGVVARARTITRRRRTVAAAGAVGAGMLLVGVVVGVGSLTGRGVHPGPLDQSPTGTATSPTPTTSVPLPSPTETSAPSPSQTSAPSPTNTPAPTSSPWTVSSVDLPADPAHPAPPQTGLVLTVGSRTTVVDQGNAELFIAGWTGTARRTVIYGWTQDAAFDESLRTATFDASGTLVDGPRDLTLPGVGRLDGRAFVTADGGLVVASYSTTTYTVSTLYRFSADFGDVTTVDLPAGNEVLAVTGDVAVLENVVTTTAEQGSEREITLLSSQHQRRITLPACRSGYVATPSADGSTAALSCPEQDVVRLLPLAAIASGDLHAAVHVTPTVPGDGRIGWTGIDQQGDVLATRVPAATYANWTGATTWRLAAGSARWTSATTVVSEQYVGAITVVATWDTSGDAPVVRLSTRTDPVVELGTATQADYAVRLQPAS